jgi:hypothetical protein
VLFLASAGRDPFDFSDMGSSGLVVGFPMVTKAGPFRSCLLAWDIPLSVLMFL